MATDFLVTDPLNATTPASTPAVTFASGGEALLGVLHVPAGAGPHPIVVLLHGFPGNERNFDLAQALRRAGYAALVFHYRGSWGVGGSWSWRNVLDDAARVVAAVRAESVSATYRLDPRRVAVVGHSLGGFAALMTAAADEGVGAVVSVAGFDFGTASAACRADPSVRAAYVESWDAELLPLRGTSGEALVAEMEAAAQAWSLARLAPNLADRPVLLVGTGRDMVTPAEVHHWPLVEEYQAYPVSRLDHRLLPTDHALSDHRVALARTIVDFLDRCLRTPAADATAVEQQA
jgi:pimeloyl-ACP methyl ester carboxylesterase